MAIKPAAVAKWFGLQIAGKALSVALGTSLVAGALMGVLAYMQHLPLAWGFFAVMGVVAFTATAMNQARLFSVAYNVADKLVMDRLEIGRAETEGKHGYYVGIILKNKSDVPLAFRVEREIAHLEGKVAMLQDKKAQSVIPPGEIMGHMIGTVPSELMPNTFLQGRFEIVLPFGRVGNLKHERTYRYRITAQTNQHGDVIGSHYFELGDA